MDPSCDIGRVICSDADYIFSIHENVDITIILILFEIVIEGQRIGRAWACYNVLHQQDGRIGTGVSLIHIRVCRV
jgi:hypothetical protein